jgi:hypothetical protein
VSLHLSIDFKSKDDNGKKSEADTVTTMSHKHSVVVEFAINFVKLRSAIGSTPLFTQ